MRVAHFFTLCLVGTLAACGSSNSGPHWSPYPTPPPRDENYHGGQNALLLKYDANHDGTLTKEELITGLKAEFAALDTKHTGCLTPDQVDAINQARIAADQSTANAAAGLEPGWLCGLSRIFRRGLFAVRSAGQEWRRQDHAPGIQSPRQALGSSGQHGARTGPETARRQPTPGRFGATSIARPPSLDLG